MEDIPTTTNSIFDDITQTQQQPIVQKHQTNFQSGLAIYRAGLISWRIWIYMALAEIRRRYRRTLIGPFWLTLSVAIFIGSVGIIFPMLWHTDVKTYLPFFASGYVVWIFISTMIVEASGTYIDSIGLVKQTTLPYSVYANNVVTRNVIVLAHHLIVYIIITIAFQVPIGLNTLLFFPGMLILCVTSSWICILFGLLASRYRDIRQIVTSLLQISMFVTPIFWQPSQLGTGIKATLLLNANPLYHFIQIVRLPLLNQAPSLNNWIVTILLCSLGWMMTLTILGKYKKHLVFWL
jgi:lipopolysaccharide transport system permease protein